MVRKLLVAALIMIVAITSLFLYSLTIAPTSFAAGCQIRPSTIPQGERFLVEATGLAHNQLYHVEIGAVPNYFGRLGVQSDNEGQLYFYETVPQHIQNGTYTARFIRNDTNEIECQTSLQVGEPTNTIRCTINPNSVSIGDEITITINGLPGNSSAEVELVTFGGPALSFSLHFSQNSIGIGHSARLRIPSTATIPEYLVQVRPDGSSDWTACTPNISIQPGVTLELPISPIENDIKTIPVLIISGLDASVTYHITLGGGWDGDYLDKDDVEGNNDGTEYWTADSNGKITATNICDNGESNRVNCEDKFEDDIYDLQIWNNGNYAGSVNFEVKTNSLVPGHNPCKDTDGDGIADKCKTALGDIPTDITAFAAKFLSIAIGLAGGIALILLVYGSIRVLTSSGNQQSLAAGRDIIIAAVAGLLFLIFSVLILRALGLIIGISFL